MRNNLLKLFACMFFGLTLAENAKAEDDIIQVTPFAAMPGVTENEWDEDLAFSIQMNNSQPYTALQFDLWLPQGMTLISDEPLELLRERFPGIVKKGVFYPEHNITMVDLGDGHYRVEIWHETFAPIIGESGDIMVCYYLTSADMAPGYYPIKISGAILAVDSHNSFKPETSTSYVKIGNPGADATLSMTGRIPSFVNEALALETGLGTLDCGQVTSVDGTFRLVDGRNFVAPVEDAVTEAVTYHRDCPSNKWGTVCLPFSVESDASVQYFKLSEVEVDKLVFEPVESVEAGTPAVFKILSGDALDISVDNAVLHAGECSTVFDGLYWTMKGSYSAFSLDPEAAESQSVSQYFISMDKFWYNNVAVPLDAFRAWFEVPNSSQVRMFSIAESDNTTEIELIGQDGEEESVCFDIAGRRLSCKSKGINITNNKKLLIR